MNAHERYVRALRDAASAYEEAHCGKVRKRRHRGPVAPAGEVRSTPEIEAHVDAVLDRAGLRRTG